MAYSPPSLFFNPSSRELRSLVIQSRRLTDERALGSYKSAFRGQGLEFEEVRAYVPGDDIRSIDWKVTARSGQPHIKSYREERELSVMLCCDLSLSTVSGTRGALRRDVINQVAAILTLVAMNNRDRVGLTTFSSAVHKLFKPERKRSSHLRILSELLEEEHQVIAPGTDILGVVRLLRTVLRRRSTIFILSDLNPSPFNPEFSTELSALARRHEVAIFQIVDPSESELPKSGLWPFIDPESGEEYLIDLASGDFQRAFTESSRLARERLASQVRECGSDLLEIRTDANLIATLKAYFERRVLRRR
jgi:uncharacterized protein (DUF58 family)